MPVSVGPHQTRGDLGAVDGCSHRAKVVVKGGDIEASEMKKFQDIGVLEQCTQIGGLGLALRDLYQVAVSVAAGHLDQAKPVAVRVQAHCFAVDRDHRSKIKAVRQVVLIKVVRHVLAFLPHEVEMQIRLVGSILKPAARAKHWRQAAMDDTH